MKYYSDPNAMKIFSKITSLLGLPDDMAKAGACVCLCVCVCERERARESERDRER